MNHFLKNIFKSSYQKKIEQEFNAIEQHGLTKTYQRIAYEQNLFYKCDGITCQIFWDTQDSNPNIVLEINNRQVDLQIVKNRIMKATNFDSPNQQKQTYYIYNLVPLEIYLKIYVDFILEYIMNAKLKQ